MSTSNKNLENFIKNFASSFEEMKQSVQGNLWTFDFDEASDILYFHPRNKQVSEDSILIPAGETGISARVNVDGKIESIVVEDFGAIFVRENSEFENFYKKLATKEKTQIEPNTIRRAYAMLLTDFQVAAFSTPAA